MKPWLGIKDATNDGDACTQANPTFVDGPTSESCLYLNVYSKKVKLLFLIYCIVISINNISFSTLGYKLELGLTFRKSCSLI